MPVVELEPTTPYGEMEFWLSPTESAIVRAKGPFFITDFTLVEWTKSLVACDAVITVTSQADVAEPLGRLELSVRIGQIAQTRRLRWPALLWFLNPTLTFQLEGDAATQRVLLRIHHEEVLP